MNVYILQVAENIAHTVVEYFSRKIEEIVLHILQELGFVVLKI